MLKNKIISRYIINSKYLKLYLFRFKLIIFNNKKKLYMSIKSRNFIIINNIKIRFEYLTLKFYKIKKYHFLLINQI